MLDVGGEGTWDDLMVDCPFVFRPPGRDAFLFYTGRSTKSNLWGIGLAYSRDLIHWMKYPENPVISSKHQGVLNHNIDAVTWLSYHNNDYLFFEAVEKHGNEWMKHWVNCWPYSLQKIAGSVYRKLRRSLSKTSSQVIQHAKGRAIGIAISRNKIHWQFETSNPVFAVSHKHSWDSCGVFSPCVLKFGEQFFLFYGGSDGKKVRTGLAVSKDLFSWRRNSEPILQPGCQGEWDESSALIVSILPLEDSYVAFYEGQNRFNEYGVGLAFSQNLIKWEKYIDNPILTKGPEEGYDSKVVNSPHVFMDSGQVYLFYGAKDLKKKGRCLMARLVL